MSASPSNMPSVDAVQIHPDFGYLAPTMRFRRRLALTLKAGVLGALAGAAAVFFVTVDREDKPITMLATPVLIAPAASTPIVQPQAPVATAPAAPARAPAVATPAPSTPATPRPPRVGRDAVVPPPVRFLPQTIALPQAQPRDLGLRGSTPPIAAGAGLAPQAPATVAMPPEASADTGTPAAVAKTVAKPKKKVVRAPPPEPESRAAFAGSQRRLGLPIFGFGW